MKTLLLIPFAAQGLVMAFDEFYCHRRRGLSRWERIGHPLDTLSMLSCFLVTVFFEYSSESLFLYGALALLSCLLVTKDEWVHAKDCSGFEHWLHSVLFILHPVALISGALIWRATGSSQFLAMQTVLIGVFLVYQTTYWNILWKPRTKQTQLAQ